MSTLAFSHIPKTGGSTLVGILRRSYGNAHCDVEPIRGRGEAYGSRDHRLARRLHPGLVSIAGHRVTPACGIEDPGGDVLYYTVFREPFERLVSQYQFLSSRWGRGTFHEAIHETRWKDRQARQLAGVADARAAVDLIRRKDVLIGLIEHFDEFLVMLRMRWGDPRLDIRYQRRNVARDRRIEERLRTDLQARRGAEEANPADFELWRLIRGEVYPAQREKFPGLEREIKRFRKEPPLPSRSPREIVGRLHRNLIYKPVLRTLRKLH